jgi:hypothetical protein
MYKITWSLPHDPFQIVLILVPDVHTLFEVYYVLTNSTKVGNIIVSNLSGDVMNMKEGLANVAYQGTHSKIQKG